MTDERDFVIEHIRGKREAMTDIVERLEREGSGKGLLDGDGTDALLLEAAAEIRRLREEQLAVLGHVVELRTKAAQVRGELTETQAKLRRMVGR